MKRIETKILGDVFKEFIIEQGLQEDFTRIEVFNAWDEVVGVTAAKLTSNKFFKNGILYCTISSSMLRTQLYYQVDGILSKLKARVPNCPVEKIVLK